jgi:hypothetical protein
MKTIKFFAIILIFFASSCKKETEVMPDPYAFLAGKWLSSNGTIEHIFDPATRTSTITKIPTSNPANFLIGEEFWKNVTSIGTDKWEVNAIYRTTSSTTPTYPKATLTKRDENSLIFDSATTGVYVLKRSK